MKPFVALALILTLASTVSAQTGVVFFEDFSDNSAGWTNVSWQRGPAQPYSHTVFNTTFTDPDHDAYNVPGGWIAGTNIGGGVGSSSCAAARTLTSPAIDLTGLPAVTLNHWRKLAIYDSNVGYINALIEVWDGSSWIVLWQSTPNFVANGTPIIFSSGPDWTPLALDVTAYANAEFKVRFTLVGNTPSVCTPNAGSSMPGWSIDNVALVVPGPPNDLCAGAATLATGPNPASFFGATETAAADLAPICGFVAALPDVWFQYTTTIDVVAKFHRFGGVGMALYQGSCTNPTLMPAYCGNTQTFDDVLLFAGTTYFLRVGSNPNTVPTIELSLFFPALPIGVGCPPSTILSGTPPQLGSVGTITLAAQPFALGALLVSAPNLTAAYTPFGPCTLYVLNPALLFSALSTDATGAWSLSIPFPSDPVWDGFAVDMQCIAFGPAGIEASNALRITLF